MLKEIIIFSKEFIRSFKTTGSVCPTSQWAAKEMVKPLADRIINNNNNNNAYKILELGPGTGSVTRWILKEMNFQDSLSICEINERFMASLKKTISNNPYYLSHQSRIDFHCCPMQSLKTDKKFDLIVCAIPFLNLNTKLVAEIYNKISDLSHQGTQLTFYQYIGLRQLGKHLLSNKSRSRLRELDNLLSAIENNHCIRKKIIWRNFLPVIIYTLSKLTELDKTIKLQEGNGYTDPAYSRSFNYDKLGCETVTENPKI